MPNYSLTSTGEKVSEATIKSRLSKAYRDKYGDSGHPICEGCNLKPAQGSAHIVPKSRLKVLHLSEKIYDPELFFPSCYSCNQIAENPSSEGIRGLRNFDRILEVTKKYDPERYSKMI